MNYRRNRSNDERRRAHSYFALFMRIRGGSLIDSQPAETGSIKSFAAFAKPRVLFNCVKRNATGPAVHACTRSALTARNAANTCLAPINGQFPIVVCGHGR